MLSGDAAFNRALLVPCCPPPPPPPRPPAAALTAATAAAATAAVAPPPASPSVSMPSHPPLTLHGLQQSSAPAPRRQPRHPARIAPTTPEYVTGWLHQEL